MADTKETKSNEEVHEENNTFVATETGEKPTAEDYLGDGEYTSTEPILQGSPHYHNGRLITTQEELDEIRAKFDEYAKDDKNVVNPGGDKPAKK
jgi:hypothetical protein